MCPRPTHHHLMNYPYGYAKTQLNTIGNFIQIVPKIVITNHSFTESIDTRKN